MSVKRVLSGIQEGSIVIRHTTAISPPEASLLMDSIDRGWPIGLITATPVGTGLEVIDGGNRLGALYMALTGSQKVTRLLGDGVRWTEDKDADGLPASVLPKTVAFLKWATERTDAETDEGHEVATRVLAYTVPFAIIPQRPSEALRVRLNG